MIEREDVGSWMEGPPRRGDSGDYPGHLLGLPPEGPGSMAPMGRRVLALLLDGLLAQLMAMSLLGYVQGQGGLGTFKPLLVVLLMNVFMVGTGGYTIGHRIFGLRVDRCPSGYAGFVKGLIRSVLLCLAFPPLIVDRDGRGLHDRVAGTVIVRSR